MRGRVEQQTEDLGIVETAIKQIRLGLRGHVTTRKIGWRRARREQVGFLRVFFINILTDIESMTQSNTVLVVGGGVFGLSAALSLQARGFQCVVFDKGESIPAPNARSKKTT